MKAIKYFSVVFVSVIFMMGCASVKVVTDTKSDANFSNYQTYKVVHYVNEEDQKAQKYRVNPINRGRIESAITSNADLRGMKKAESNPDVVILWASDVDVEKSYSSHTTYSGGAYMGYRGRYYMGGGGPSYTTTDVNEYHIGILSIAIVEKESEELLWLGKGTKDISGDERKAEETINLIVGKIMEEFPIGAVPE